MGALRDIVTNNQVTKSTVTGAFNILENFGYLVMTSNSHKNMPPGLKGFPDHTILGKSRIIYIEVKLGKDKLSPEQEQFKRYAVSVMLKNDFSSVLYFVADEKNYTEIRDIILINDKREIRMYAELHYKHKLITP